MQAAALDGLTNLAKWERFTDVFIGAKDTRILLSLLPETLQDPISAQTKKALEFFGSLALNLSSEFEIFNDIYLKLLHYFYSPLLAVEENFAMVSDCFEEYVNYSFSSCLTLDTVLSISRRLLELQTLINNTDHQETIYRLLVSIVVRESKRNSLKNIRVEILDSLCDTLDTAMDDRRILALFNHCVEIIQEIRVLVDQFFGNDKIMHIFRDFLTSDALDVKERLQVLSALFHCCNDYPAIAVQVFLKHQLMQPTFAILARLINENPHHYPFLSQLQVMLHEAETLVDDNEYLYNPIAIEIEAAGGLEILLKCFLAQAIRNAFFSEAWQLYLSRRRGFKTKKAVPTNLTSEN